MSDVNVLANRPLARAAQWFLVDAGIVLAVFCGLALRPDWIPDFIDHPPLVRIGAIAMMVLFTLLAATASVLGFLANCRPGRTTGTIALAVLVGGWAAIAAALAFAS